MDRHDRTQPNPKPEPTMATLESTELATGTPTRLTLVPVSLLMAENDPFFLPEGDYLLFLRRDAQNRWVLVGDFVGIQPLTKALDVFVKEVHAKRTE